MKLFFASIFFFAGANCFAATPKDCVSGNFAACKEIFNKYGSTSDKAGAVELFTNACASQDLRVVCQVTSIEKAETLKKALELAKPETALFVMSGKNFDKIYQISQLK